MSTTKTPPSWRTIGRAALLISAKRPPLPVTIREISVLDEASVIEGEARPYTVTIDDGLCAGLRLWAAERELRAAT